MNRVYERFFSSNENRAHVIREILSDATGGVKWLCIGSVTGEEVVDGDDDSSRFSSSLRT